MNKSKTPSESSVEMTELVLPNHTNLLGNLLGGQLMHWMDIAAGMSASRHSNSNVATAAVDNLVFHHPIKLGELVNLKAKVTWTGRTSMELFVKVFAENTLTGELKLSNEAFLTFVALDKKHNPIPVPALKTETAEEEEDYKQAEERRKIRLKIKEMKVKY